MASADEFENRNPIETLVFQLLDGSISQADKERLNSLLLESQEGRSLFLHHSQVESGLHSIYSARKQVATIIDSSPSGTVRPVADVAQQQLRFRDDVRFIQVMNACAANESHSQDWLQIFPRVLAVTSLCVPPGPQLAGAVQAIVDQLLLEYSADMSSSVFWEAADRATSNALQQTSGGNKHTADISSALRRCAFAPPAGHPQLDAVSIHEILDDCIPHRLPADTLRVLCLRYLNGLSLGRIAAHLNRSNHEVQAYLAKVRVHLVGRCVTGAGGDVKRLNVSELLRWSSLFDAPTPEAFLRMARGHAGNMEYDPTPLLLLGMVHDHLWRQLSATRLLDEIPSQKNNKPYLSAIEQSLRDIETLGTTQPPSRETPQPGKFSQRSLQLVALLSLAAGVLIAMGIGLMSRPSQTHAPEKIADKTERPVPVVKPQQPQSPTPVAKAVVAIVTEAIGVSTQDHDRLAIGAELRIEDRISLEQGVVELTTPAGCNLILEGPVDVTLAEMNRIVLRRGKVTGLNETADTSLVIDSPNASIIDVGTEFGVAVNEAQETFVAVYEGSVELAPPHAASDQSNGESLGLAAGWEAAIDNAAGTQVQTQPLSHDREFVRRDEVQLRKAAAEGDRSSAAKVAYFQLLRKKGLLCFQGFHGDSSANDLTFGFRNPALRRQGATTFEPNINESTGALGLSHSLGIGKNGSCYLDVDASDQSRLVRAGLADVNGMIGRRSGELWICWRTKAVGASETKFSWAGLSLMFGDNRSVDEPLFVGQPAPLSHFGIHTHPGMGQSLEIAKSLDSDPSIPDEQIRSPDFDEHLWLMRLTMSGRSAEIAVWCDVNPNQAADVPPAVTQVIEDFHFNRIRLEAQPEGENGQWLFDDVIFASSAEVIEQVLTILKATKPNGLQ